MYYTIIYIYICVSRPLQQQDTFQAAEMVQLLAELGQSRQCATIMCLERNVVIYGLWLFAVHSINIY